MRKIEQDGKLYAIIHKMDEVEQNKTIWFNDDKDGVQAGFFTFNQGKEFKCHKHIMRPRLSNRTQEAIVVMKGIVKIFLYDDNDKPLDIIYVQAGEMCMMLRGGHCLVIETNDTRFYEFKNGPFTTVEEDKKFIGE